MRFGHSSSSRFDRAPRGRNVVMEVTPLRPRAALASRDEGTFDPGPHCTPTRPGNAHTRHQPLALEREGLVCAKYVVPQANRSTHVARLWRPILAGKFGIGAGCPGLCTAPSARHPYGLWSPFDCDTTRASRPDLQLICPRAIVTMDYVVLEYDGRVFGPAEPRYQSRAGRGPWSRAGDKTREPS